MRRYTFAALLLLILCPLRGVALAQEGTDFDRMMRLGDSIEAAFRAGAGSTEFGAADDSLAQGAIGASLYAGPFILTLDQEWMRRDFEFGGKADFSTFTAAGQVNLLSTDVFGLGVQGAFQQGDIDFSGGGGRDFQISPRLGLAFDLKGDGDWVFNQSYGQYVAALAASGKVGYIRMEDAFGEGLDHDGFYFTSGLAFPVAKYLNLCLDGGYTNLNAKNAPDVEYWEVGGGFLIDISRVFDLKNSSASLTGDVHYGEFDIGGSDNSTLIFQLGMNMAISTLEPTLRKYIKQGCDIGALIPMTDIRLKQGF